MCSAHISRPTPESLSFPGNCPREAGEEAGDMGPQSVLAPAPASVLGLVRIESPSSCFVDTYYAISVMGLGD